MMRPVVLDTPAIMEQQAQKITMCQSQESVFHDDDNPGTICISGRMCKGLHQLLTSWFLFEWTEDRIVVKTPDLPLELLLQGYEDKEVFFENGKLLQDLELDRSELVAINGSLFRDSKLDVIQETLIHLEGDFSIVFVKPGGDQWIKRLVVFKPLEGNIDFLSTEPNDFWAEIPCSLDFVQDEILHQQQENHHRKTRASLSTRKALCLGSLPSDMPLWLLHTPLSPGDQILSLNGKTYVQELSVADAQVTITLLFACSPAHFSLVVRTPPNTRVDSTAWRASLRKRAVAVGGGIMVGAGAVLMVTPLHPIGHAMAIGGVGVLGTEFEKPRQLARSAASAAKNFRRSLSARWHASRSEKASMDETKGSSSLSQLPGKGFDTESVSQSSDAENTSMDQT